MNNTEQEQIYKDCIKFWGKESQYGMLQEECAELIVAVSKLFRRHPDAENMVCEELADVQNMLNQFKELYPDFERVRIYKLKRVKAIMDSQNGK